VFSGCRQDMVLRAPVTSTIVMWPMFTSAKNY